MMRWLFSNFKRSIVEYFSHQWHSKNIKNFHRFHDKIMTAKNHSESK